MAVKLLRDGFHTVTPYLFAENANRVIEFTVSAFDAVLVMRKDRPDGGLVHAELRIGNSMVMTGDSSEKFGPMPASIYLYVTDCDAVYRRALEHGSVTVFDIMDLPSGERYGGVKDPCGNIWWITTHIKDVSAEEEEKRWREFRS